MELSLWLLVAMLGSHYLVEIKLFGRWVIPSIPAIATQLQHDSGNTNAGNRSMDAYNSSVRSC